ncbi:hypothetical protein HDV05_005798 [Chytridiales sp. JEL 0842]|nr:hypothetical protein HDV05_005798 [Chytridiales sp. JEL 0842]
MNMESGNEEDELAPLPGDKARISTSLLAATFGEPRRPSVGARNSTALTQPTTYQKKPPPPEKMWSRGAFYLQNNQNARNLTNEVTRLVNKPIKPAPPHLQAIKDQRELEKLSRRLELNVRRPSEVRRVSEFRRDSVLRRRDSVARHVSIDQSYNPNAENQLEEQEEFNSSARHKWKFALSYVIKLIRATSVFRNNVDVKSSFDMPALQPSDFDEAQGLTYMLKAHQSKGDIVFSSRVQAMLSEEMTPTIERTLQRLLSIRIKSFSKFTQEQQKALCAAVTYESRDPGQIIIKEGHDPWNFYFILSGQCEVYRKKGEMKNKINILNTGECFGEYVSENVKRTVSIACTMPTELLVVDKEAYCIIRHMTDKENIETRVAALSQVPHFSQAPFSVVEKAAQAAQLFTFQPQETIVFEGVENYKIFWIVSGSCRAVKLVPFLKRLTTPDCATHSKKYTFIPYEEGVTQIGPNDKLVMQLLKIRELGGGDHFPEMNAAVNMKRFNKIELMSYLSADAPNRTDAKSYVSVIATTKVEVVGMTRVDYARVATNDMILRVLEDRALLHIPMRQLQDSMLRKRSWELFKKKIVEEIICA